MAYLDDVKLAMRLTRSEYDPEVMRLIDAAVTDLEIAGVPATERMNDPIVKEAVITYCRLHFGTPDDYTKIKKSYDEQKGQLITAIGYGLSDE